MIDVVYEYQSVGIVDPATGMKEVKPGPAKLIHNHRAFPPGSLFMKM
jgi:hypothetical protein